MFTFYFVQYTFHQKAKSKMLTAFIKLFIIVFDSEHVSDEWSQGIISQIYKKKCEKKTSPDYEITIGYNHI